MKRLKLIVAALSAFSLCSCDALKDARLNRADLKAAQLGIEAALNTTDLNFNGEIDGFDEWFAAIRAMIQTAQKNKSK